MNARLCRSRTNYMLGGVCGGLGQYFGIDATIVRLVFVLLAIWGGAGTLIYLILWIVMPREDRVDTAGKSPFERDELGSRVRQVGDDIREAVQKPKPEAAKFLGIGLVLAGLLIFLQNLNLQFLSFLKMDLFWPVLLVVLGVVLLVRALKGK